MIEQFAFDRQIAAQPDAVRRVIEGAEVAPLDPSRRIILTGIGTSLHACRVAAYWAAELSKGRVRPVVLETHDLALRGTLDPADQLVLVSHRGTKRFARQILERARDAAVRTVVVTGRGAADVAGDVVLRTCDDESASTHTVSYTTALAMLGLLLARTVGDAAAGFEEGLRAVPEAMASTLALPAPADVVPLLTNKEPVLLIGFGVDEFTAIEGALKFKEGAYLWAEGMSVELALHGTPAVFEPRHAAIVAVPNVDDGGRTEALLGLLREIGVRAVTLGDGTCDLRFAPVEYLLRPFVSVIPLQRLVAELARRRGTNPDTTRSDVEPYKAAIGGVTL